uniref:J domain-containing protein n=1 Tax=Kalanchoe fedtschenkoi TaxID=63787 RepID=A0A7N0UQI9_KALFE
MQATHGFFSSGADYLLHRCSAQSPSPPAPLPYRASPSSLSFRPFSPRSISVRASARVGAAALADLSFYELLGISESGSQVEIKQAYKQLARKYHPDVSPPDQVQEYTQRFIRVQEAYETLSDPRSRALYDRDMAKGIHLAFSARRRYNSDEEDQLDGRQSEWRNQWQSQLSELKRRSASKEGRGFMSWGARMRRQKSESPMEC